MERGGGDDPRLVRGAPDRRPDGRRPPPARPHAADRVRGAGDRSRRSPSAPSCSTGTSTSSPRWPAGATGSGRGRPVIEDDKLYGRGGADDGYAAFAALVGDRVRPGRRHPARPARPADRGQRGERQPRPAGLRRGAGRPHRHARAGHLPRRRVPRRRAAVAGDVAARARQRHAHRRGADRRHPLGAGQRRRAVELPDHPPAARPHRGQRHRHGAAARAARRDPAPTASPRPPARRRRSTSRRRTSSRSPGRREPMVGRHRRAVPRPDVAADAQLHRRRRLPAARPGRQRAAAVDPPHAQLPPAADVRRAPRPPRRSRPR